MARPQKRRCICSKPRVTSFSPSKVAADGVVVIGYDEYEVMRLIDCEGFSQKKCAERMGVSRSTVARMYENVRKKISDSIVNGRELKIEGGDVIVCTSIKPECKNVAHCCHRTER